jgi:hypothetical protein
MKTSAELLTSSEFDIVYKTSLDSFIGNAGSSNWWGPGNTYVQQFINGTPGEDWRDVLVYELLPNTLRVNTIPQMYPFHYHLKDFCDTILENTNE